MCIHPLVSQSKNKQEDCRKLVEGKEVCPFSFALFQLAIS